MVRKKSSLQPDSQHMLARSAGVHTYHPLDCMNLVPASDMAQHVVQNTRPSRTCYIPVQLAWEELVKVSGCMSEIACSFQ
jgi:hypothetical protein